MIIEAFVILGTDNRHFRITRALRPFLLLDTYLMYGVRRYNYEMKHDLNYYVTLELFVRYFSV